MPTRNVYISKELHEEMEALKGTPDEPNWSGVASLAFRGAVDLAKAGIKFDVYDAMMRLRGLRAHPPGMSAPEGGIAGRAWARYDARPEELERLSIAFEGEWRAFLEPAVQGGVDLATRLYLVVTGRTIANAKRSQASAKRFWALRFGDFYRDYDFELGSIPSEYVDSFARGAMFVWTKVRDLV
jgi:hypothetical protein